MWINETNKDNSATNKAIANKNCALLIRKFYTMKISLFISGCKEGILHVSRI